MTNLNIKIFLLCPIPNDQKPINEYIGLRENTITNLLTLPIDRYKKKIITLFGALLIFFSFISLIFVQNNLIISDWFFNNFLLTFIFLNLFFILIFFRWTQLEEKLKISRLFYEEASWYDGQIWEKPVSIMKNDRLLASQKIKPLLNRNLLTICYLNSFLGLLLFFLVLF